MANLYRPTYTDRHGKKRRSSVWWYSAYRNGKRIRGSTKKRDKDAAKLVMHRKLAESEPPKPGKLTLDGLRKLIVADYELNGRKSIGEVRRNFKTLEGHFGATRKASRIDTTAVLEYARRRRKAGRAPATINRELAALRRAFNLAAKHRLVSSVPVISALDEDNARKAFLRPDQFEKLHQALPPDVGVLALVGYETGWRSGELRSRKWRHVDMPGGWLRLEPGETKNRKGRIFPLNDVLLRTLEHQHHTADEVCAGARPNGPLFFRYTGRNKGNAIKSYDKAWNKARKAAGLATGFGPPGPSGVVFHDMRRSAIRNLVRDGTPEGVAMKMTGHLTREVFERYNIVDERDMIEAMERRNARLRQKP